MARNPPSGRDDAAIGSPDAARGTTSSVSLTHVQAALSLFAEAVAGEPTAIEVPSADRDCWPWRSAAFPSDGNSGVIVAPAQLDEFATPEANRIAYRASVLHQLMAAVLHRSESGTAVQHTSSSSTTFATALYWQVLAILEDLRIDAATRHRFPGSIDGLDALLATVRASEPAPGGTSLAQALSALRWRSLGADERSVASRFTAVDPATLSSLLTLVGPIDHRAATRNDSTDAALRICRILERLAGAEQAGRSGSPDGDDRNDDATSTSEQRGGSAADQSATPDGFEPGVLSGGTVIDEFQGGVSETPDPAAEPAETTGAVADRRTRRSGLATRSYLYDEWDYKAQAHRPAWCRIVEERLDGDDHSFIGDVLSRHPGLRARIRNGFARLRPAELIRIHRSTDGDELDLDAVIEAVVDRRGGAPPDDRLHVRRDRAGRDVATAFLLDLSASTSAPAMVAEPVPFTPVDPYDDPLSWMPFETGPHEPERRVIDIAKDAVALMSDALRELGDEHAIYGFSGTGRANVDFKIAKDFGARVSPSSWAALAAMKPLRYTRMGPAIRHATAKLRAEAARTRLLIVISDGYPQDTDYGDDRSDRDYGIHDTARALADAHTSGIETFCVTIDPAGHDYLRRMCPDHRYLVIDEVESLPEELAKLYLTLSNR